MTTKLIFRTERKQLWKVLIVLKVQ